MQSAESHAMCRIPCNLPNPTQSPISWCQRFDHRSKISFWMFLISNAHSGLKSTNTYTLVYHQLYYSHDLNCQHFKVYIGNFTQSRKLQQYAHNITFSLPTKQLSQTDKKSKKFRVWIATVKWMNFLFFCVFCFCFLIFYFILFYFIIFLFHLFFHFFLYLVI